MNLNCQISSTDLLNAGFCMGACAGGGALAGLALGGPIGAGAGALVGVAFYATTVVITIITNAFFQKFPQLGNCINQILTIAASFFGSAAAIWAGLMAAGITITFPAVMIFLLTTVGIASAIFIVASPILCCLGLLDMGTLIQQQQAQMGLA